MKKIHMKEVLEDLNSTQENLFQSFCRTFLSSFYVISLKISYCLSANHVHVSFALVLHLNCTALSQSEFSSFMGGIDVEIPFISGCRLFCEAATCFKCGFLLQQSCG